MIRRWMLFMGLVFSLGISAQELEFVDLGVVEGEFRQLQREVFWVNQSDQEQKVRLVSKDKNLQPKEKQVLVAAADSLKIPFTIELSTVPGYYEYELQLIGKDDFLLHGFQFGLQILASEPDVFRAYRNINWPFRTKEKVFNLKAGYKGDTLQNTFDVYNLGGSNLELGRVYVNDSTWVTFDPEVIRHNQFGHMTISMWATDKAPSGFHKIPISLKLAGDTISNLPVQFTLLPGLQYAQDEQVSGGPTLTTNLINHDFKVLEVGEIQSVEVVLANLGQEDLKLEKLESNCDCLTYEIPKMTIAPGESISMTVTFNATGRIGLERKTLAIFSNDATNPTHVLTFRAHVK